jgi:hypothetical protein
MQRDGKRPMSPELCALATRAYGSVVPGNC